MNNDTAKRELIKLEQQLESLSNLPKPRNKKAQEKREEDIQELLGSINSLRAFFLFSKDMRVTDGNQLGIITDLTFSGVPQVWVSWYVKVSIPEQPLRLKQEPFFEQLKVGDSVTVIFDDSGEEKETFEIKGFMGDGCILTTNDQIFSHEFMEINPNEEEEIISEQEQEESSTIVKVVESSSLTETDELSDEEESDRLHLERKVERAFYEAGKALQELRDRRLYRSTHETFELYCRERFGYSRRKMDYLIAGSEVYQNLLEASETRTNCSQNAEDEMRTNCSQTKTDVLSEDGFQSGNDEMRTNGSQTKTDVLDSSGLQNDSDDLLTNGYQTKTDVLNRGASQILPTSERQTRYLSQLEPNQQREAWQKAVKEAGGKVPSGRIVKSVVDKIREKSPVPNPWRKNEVAQIIPKNNPDLRGKAGCWCIITEVNDYSCTVQLYDGEYQAKLENLKGLDYSNEQQEMVKGLCDRLSKIKLDDVEQAVRDFVKGLGRLDRPWLTELEEKMLTVIEGDNE